MLTRASARVPEGAPPALQDHVVLEFVVTVEGKADQVTVLESAGEAWDRAAVEALKAWTFRPALHEGQKVPSKTQLQFTMPATVVALPDAGPAAAVEGRDAGPGGTEVKGAEAGPAEAPGSPGPGVAAGEADAGAVLTPDIPESGHPRHEMSTTVKGRLQPRSRGASDLQLAVGQLKVVPRATGGEFLKLAPGILLTNEGGEGHPDRVFLRGFDAREGQDLEMSVDGVPVNDSGNLHGNGYADLNFIIPELVENLRVIEGPFDPRQGNYAVAGSVDYELGLTQRGLTTKVSQGQYGAQRLLVMFGPGDESRHTFAAAQLHRTNGYGQNRAAQSASVQAQFESELGAGTSFRVAAQGYAAQFKSAGVLRADDVAAGRVGFYDTLDDRQGGDSQRASVSAELHHHRGGFTHHQQAFVVFRGSRLLENFTGFLMDPQEARQSPHEQRGDLLDRDTQALTVGARGYGRYRGTWLSRPQELELGYFARLDSTQGQQQRLLAGSNVPYRKDLDLSARLSDIGLYVDGNLSLRSWLTVRGGVRADLFTWDVQDACAVQDVRRPSSDAPPGDSSCLSQRDFGLYREPTQRVTATGSAVMPRASVLLGPWRDVTLSGSYGVGVRSVDPLYVAQDRSTPFAGITAWEGGVAWARKPGEGLDASARAVVFGTRVDKDLVFSEQAGRNVIGGSTSRLGALVQGRARGGWWDTQAHATWVQSRFDDTGLLVPYVPDLVVRGDGAVFHELPWTLDGSPLKGTGGLGVTYVGRRALPYGQRSDVIFTLDASAEVTWRFVVVGLSATNLLDTRYRLAEFNYASDFRQTPPYPTLVPARHFSAGAPRQVMVTVAFTVGGDR